MIQEHLLSELRRIVSPQHVETGPVARETYSYDASLASAAPGAVVFPADTAQVSAVVKAAARAGVCCTPRGFGTNLSGGTVPLRGGVVIGLSRMNRILAIQPQRASATVQCGLTNLELQNALAPLGFFYAPDPASQKVSTLGGNAAENSGGPHCLKYGVTTNHILGLEAVLADGEVVQLGGAALDPPGYDLRGLFIGSEGTFGIVTQITVRIMPRPELVVTLLAVYDDVADAARSVAAIIARGIVPATLEMMDAPIIHAVEASFPCGYPLDAAAVLIIEVEGPAAGLKQQAEDIQQVCMANGCRSIREAKDSAERDQLWAGRRGAFGAIARIAPNYLVADCSVPRTRLPEALERVAAITKRHGFKSGNVFHAGDGNLHPLLLFDARNREQLARVHEAGREIMQACADLGGTITGEHGVGAEKLEAMRLVFSEDDLDFQRAVRHAIDPEERLNPGKVLPEAKAMSNAECRMPNGKAPVPDVRYSTLGSECSTLGLAPADAADACAMVRAAASSRTALLCVGGGRRADFGNKDLADRQLIPLHTDKLSALVEHDPPNQVVTAGAGLRLAELQKILAADRQWLPLRPPLADGCTLGGMAALGGCGPERYRYGGPRDRLLGLRFVSGTGLLIAAGGKVVKNVAGYDVTRLLAGSAGTLGLITELTFSVLAMPQVCRAAIARGPLPQCAAAAAELLRSNVEPVFVTAGPDRAADGGPPNAWRLAVGFEGFDVTAQAQVQRCRAVLGQAGLAIEPEQDYPTHAGFHAGAFAGMFKSPFLLRADLPPDGVLGFLARADRALGGAELQADLACGRVYAGLPGLGDDDWTAVCTAAAGAGGQVILDQAPPEFKQRHDVFGPARSEWELMHRIKRELDPHAIFAPGRLPGRTSASSVVPGLAPVAAGAKEESIPVLPGQVRK